jgi:hypothetical protein
MRGLHPDQREGGPGRRRTWPICPPPVWKSDDGPRSRGPALSTLRGRRESETADLFYKNELATAAIPPDHFSSEKDSWQRVATVHRDATALQYVTVEF